MSETQAAEIKRLISELSLCRAERDAADEVSRTARAYVEAMRCRLDITIILLEPFAARDISDPDCRAARDWLESIKAVKS